jgi:hypothetical protein
MIDKIQPPELKPKQIDSTSTQKYKRHNISILIFAGLVHLEILLIALYIAMAQAKVRENIIVTTEMIQEYEPIDLSIKRTVQKITEDNEMIDAEPVATTDDIFDPRQTENNQETHFVEGVSEAISVEPLIGNSIFGNMGGGGGEAGAFSSRSGEGKKKAIMKGGGSKKTESAVDAALSWLMRQQENDGHWNKNKFGVEKNNNGFERRKIETNSVLTGLATLAFISAGNTPVTGKYKETVNKSINWILQRQLPNGSFGDSFEFSCYNNSICALVLSELAGMCPDPKYTLAAQRAIEFIVQTKNVHEGFSNYPNIPRSTSVNGWFLMALKSAMISGLKTPPFIFDHIHKRLLEITSKDSLGNYQYVNYLDLGDRKDKSSTMTAVGMMMYENLGVSRIQLKGLADQIVKDLPVYGELSLNQEMYRWYNTTLALYQFGGEHWKIWNAAITDLLIHSQKTTGPLDGSVKDLNGSWDCEKDHFGQNLGRIYTTAMGALCLEVYYRYDQLYQKND